MSISASITNVAQITIVIFSAISSLLSVRLYFPF
nr:MAG TPA: hypothetical protein [Caudoviricetes sp.]